MFPLHDNIPGRSRPLVGNVLILACLAVFAYELSLDRYSIQRMRGDWGMVPSDLVQQTTRHDLDTLFTSLFLHGGHLRSTR